jgi:hypothetical protein
MDYEPGRSEAQLRMTKQPGLSFTHGLLFRLGRGIPPDRTKYNRGLAPPDYASIKTVAAGQKAKQPVLFFI